jgi:hypothetical protein
MPWVFLQLWKDHWYFCNFAKLRGYKCKNPLLLPTIISSLRINRYLSSFRHCSLGGLCALRTVPFSPFRASPIIDLVTSITGPVLGIVLAVNVLVVIDPVAAGIDSRGTDCVTHFDVCLLRPGDECFVLWCVSGGTARVNEVRD